MDYKYTTDGKKVVVIGALNSKETIVQEIYIVDGSEIPAGEHFIAKSLLDAPAETYKSKEEKRLTESIERQKAELAKMEKLVAQFRERCVKSMEVKLRWIDNITEPEVKNVITAITDYITGVYTHVVFKHGSKYLIHEWSSDLFVNTESRYYDAIYRYDSVRLVSIFGYYGEDRDGRRPLDWQVNSYSDGSGGCNTKFKPCKSYAEAVEAVKSFIYAKPELSKDDYETCIEYGIPVDAEKNRKRIEAHNASKRHWIEENTKKIKELEGEILEIPND